MVINFMSMPLSMEGKAGKMETTNLTVRVVDSPEEVERFNTEEARHHELGKTHSGGDTLRLVFENEGMAVVKRR